MNGPEHYREAERLLDEAQSTAADLIKQAADQGNLPLVTAAAQQHANIVAIAQAHATLALAAMAERAVTPVVHMALPTSPAHLDGWSGEECDA